MTVVEDRLRGVVEQELAESLPHPVRVHGQVADGVLGVGDEADGFARLLQHPYLDCRVVEQLVPALADIGSGVGELGRWEDLRQFLHARGLLDGSQSRSLAGMGAAQAQIRTVGVDPRRIPFIEQRQQSVGDPVRPSLAALFRIAVGLLDAPGIDAGVFGGDQQAVTARSNEGNLVEIEDSPTDRVVHDDCIVGHCQPRMQPETPAVQHRRQGKDAEQDWQHERVLASVDHPRQGRDSGSAQHDKGDDPGQGSARGPPPVPDRSVVPTCTGHQSLTLLRTSLYHDAMAGVAVLTDSTASLSPDLGTRAGVETIPLQVVIDGVSAAESRGGHDAAVVAQALRAHRRVTTSRPGQPAFVGAYQDLAEQGYTAVVAVHLSSEVSGTCAAAALAAHDSPIPVRVVDTRSLAMGTGFAVLSAADVAAAGGDLDAVAAAAQRRAEACRTYFSVDDLDYLRRGGRIGTASALLGSALAVKPILTIAEGQIRPYEKVRTAARAHARLVELAIEAVGAAGPSGADVAVHHLDDVAGAEHLAAQIRTGCPSGTTVLITEVSAVIAVHTGPGTFGVVIAPRL